MEINYYFWIGHLFFLIKAIHLWATLVSVFVASAVTYDDDGDDDDGYTN